MSGAIAMGTSKITGVGDPTANQDAATKNYTDTQDALKLNLSGGTMSGAIAMGTNKITGAGDPTNAQDVATKNYIPHYLVVLLVTVQLRLLQPRQLMLLLQRLTLLVRLLLLRHQLPMQQTLMMILMTDI